ncbi:hypothetical protein RRG08_040773 [Elysia crispata]|uniref:Uncharacterized protein n=1 Tax=Elysia crispata TaxID=231223 RepID=A0AAE1BF47_9GAST|nr:hypothetical protein RRG08_040773 [Elysia crispata]
MEFKWQVHHLTERFIGEHQGELSTPIKQHPATKECLHLPSSKEGRLHTRELLISRETSSSGCRLSSQQFMSLCARSATQQ